MSPNSCRSWFAIRVASRAACCCLVASLASSFPCEVPAQELPPSQSSTSRPPDALKEPFDVLPSPPQKRFTLAELEQLALQNNPSLGVAAANVSAARGRQVQS